MTHNVEKNKPIVNKQMYMCFQEYVLPKDIIYLVGFEKGVHKSLWDLFIKQFFIANIIAVHMYESTSSCFHRDLYFSQRGQ